MTAEKVAGGIERFVDAVGRLTAWSSFILALVMGGNVLLRYGFNTGSVWSQELEWHLMSPICLFGMSYALVHKEHVRVDVLFASYSQRTKDFIEFVSAVLGALICLLIIKLSYAYVMQSWNIGEGTANPGGIPARYLLKALIPVGFAVLFLQYLSHAIQYFLAWRKAS